MRHPYCYKCGRRFNACVVVIVQRNGPRRRVHEECWMDMDRTWEEVDRVYATRIDCIG